jgi:phosphoglycolate phosphatase
MKIKLAVFDLDGTVVNTLPDIAHVNNSILKSYGFKEHDLTSYRNFVGWGLRRTLEMSLPEGVPQKLFEEIYGRLSTEYNNSSVIYSEVYHGINDILGFFNNKNIRTVIYTNKPQKPAEIIIEHFFKNKFFSDIIGSGGIYPNKPDPSALVAYMDNTGVEPSEVVFIGDSEIDLNTAVNSGVHFLCAGWGFRSPESLKQAGADNIFTLPEELYRWLLKNIE